MSSSATAADDDDAAEVAEAMTEYAVSLRAAGHSLTKVSKMTGVPRGTVYYRIKRLACAPKAKGRKRSLEASEEASLRQWAAEEGLKRLEDFKVRIKADFAKDVSLRTIRRALDRSPGSGSGENGGADGGGNTDSRSRTVSADELKLKSKKRAAIVAKVMTANAATLQAEGHSLTEIAKTTGVPRGTLYYRIQHLGRPQKRKGRRPTLDAVEEASVRLWAAELGGKKLDAVKKKLKAEFGKDVSTRTLRRVIDRDTTASTISTSTESTTTSNNNTQDVAMPDAAVIPPSIELADAFRAAAAAATASALSESPTHVVPAAMQQQHEDVPPVGYPAMSVQVSAVI